MLGNRLHSTINMEHVDEATMSNLQKGVLATVCMELRTEEY